MDFNLGKTLIWSYSFKPHNPANMEKCKYSKKKKLTTAWILHDHCFDIFVPLFCSSLCRSLGQFCPYQESLEQHEKSYAHHELARVSCYQTLFDQKWPIKPETSAIQENTLVLYKGSSCKSLLALIVEFRNVFSRACGLIRPNCSGCPFPSPHLKGAGIVDSGTCPSPSANLFRKECQGCQVSTRTKNQAAQPHV